MNRRKLFYGYTFLTLLVLFLARNKLLDLTLKNMYIINFGLISAPVKLMLLNANMIIFDLVSILLARSAADSIETFLQIRKVGFFGRLKAFKKCFTPYLVCVIIAHLFLINSSNWIISWGMLAIFVVIWLILVGLPMYNLANYIRLIVILMSLIIFRIIA